MLRKLFSGAITVRCHHRDCSPGAVATDFDGDGRLELLVSHGESAAQPLSVYRVNQVSGRRSVLHHLISRLTSTSLSFLPVHISGHDQLLAASHSQDQVRCFCPRG